MFLLYKDALDKAVESSTIYCPVNHVHSDITDYQKILSGLQQFCKFFYVRNYLYAAQICKSPRQTNSNTSAAVEVLNNCDFSTLMKQGEYTPCNE